MSLLTDSLNFKIELYKDSTELCERLLQRRLNKELSKRISTLESCDFAIFGRQIILIDRGEVETIPLFDRGEILQLIPSSVFRKIKREDHPLLVGYMETLWKKHYPLLWLSKIYQQSEDSVS